MGNERHITDNPFRILNIGSQTTQRELARLAASHAMSSRVGLVEPSPFDKEFGPYDIQDLVSHVRSISNAPKRRTFFRFFWPLSDTGANLLKDGGNIAPGSLPKFEVDHLLFLSDWFDFLASESVASAKDALASWTRLHADYTDSEAVVKVAASIKEKNPNYNLNASYSILGIKLSTAIKDDDDLDYCDAFPIWDEVSPEIADYLVTRITQAADEKWNDGMFVETLALMTMAVNSRNLRITPASLNRIVESGTRRMRQVESMRDSMSDLKIGSSLEAPEVVSELFRLSEVLGPHHPVARLWQDVVLDWNTNLAHKVRELALSLSDQRKYVEAKKLIVKALSLEISWNVRERLEEDNASLEVLIANDIYRDILPIASAPSLHTFNGIGQMLYQTSRFPGDPTKHFAILFLTIAYIPIIPIERYLVTSSGRNSWAFHGKTPWTKWMKGHLAGVIGLILISAILGLAGSPHSGRPLQTEQETSSSNGEGNPTSFVENSAQSDFSLPAPEQARAEAKHQSAVAKSDSEPVAGASGGDSSTVISEGRDDGGKAAKRKLQETKLASIGAELDNLKSEIKSQSTGLDSEQARLAELRKAIDCSSPNAANEDEVSAYNALVDRYKADRLVYNEHVTEFNGKIAKQRKLVARYNDLVHQINEDK